MIQDREPDLPITPTNEGRNPNLENFGYQVAFNDLWPLLIGVSLSGIAGIAFFVVGARPFHWSVCLVLTLAPLATAHIYIKKFIEGALPHTQEDVIAGWLSLRPSWAAPGKFILLPTWRKQLTMAAQPPWHSGTLHPLMRLRREFERQKKA